MTKTTIKDVLETLEKETGVSRDAPIRVRVFHLTWLAVPLAFYLAVEWAFNAFAPEMADGNERLLAFEIVLFALLVPATLLLRQSFTAGWRAPHGFSWLWIAGPLWLGVLTPISAAHANYAAAPETIALYLAIAFFVAVNEETIFRGFILRGMAKSFHPMIAVVASSLAFGALHFLNIDAGGDPVFVGAQMVSAFGVGAIMAAMTLRSGSTLPAILFHFLGDFVGLGAIGGYEQGIQSAELAPSLIISGLVFAAWGLFWSWRTVKSGKARL